MVMAAARPIEEPLIERLPVVRGLYEENAELGKRSWFRTGGKVEVLFQPADADDLQAFMEERPSNVDLTICLLYTSPSPRDRSISRMPSSA